MIQWFRWFLRVAGVGHVPATAFNRSLCMGCFAGCFCFLQLASGAATEDEAWADRFSVSLMKNLMPCFCYTLQLAFTSGETLGDSFRAVEDKQQSILKF